MNVNDWGTVSRPSRVWYVNVNYRKGPGQPVQCEDMSIRAEEPVQALRHLRVMLELRHGTDYVVQGYFECVGDIMYRVHPVTGDRLD